VPGFGLLSLGTDSLVSVLRPLHSFPTLAMVASNRLAGAGGSLWTPDGRFVHRNDLHAVSHGKSLAERTFRRPGATDSRCCRRRAIVVSERVAFLSADCGHLAVADVAGDDNPVFRGRGRHTSGKLPPRRKHRGTAPE